MITNEGSSDGVSGSAEEQERFLLRRPVEVAAMLNRLARRPEIITGYFNSGRSHVITAVLAADVESNTLFLDVGPDAAVNRAAVRADRLVCIAKHNDVSIKFACGPVVQGEYRGTPALVATLPESLYRLQRREYFRVPTPVASAVCCRIPDTRKAEGVHEFRAVDLSMGGVGLVDLAMKLQLAPGRRFGDAILDIPEGESLSVSLEVRNISRYIQHDGRVGRRLGMAFLQLSRRGSMRIQRYLHHLQVLQRDTRPDLVR